MGKGGGGVMIMTKKELLVKSVVYGEGKAEIVSVNLENKNRERMTITTTYAPPRTNSWSKEKHEIMIEDTIQSLSRILKANKRVLLVGDFIRKEIDWEMFESGGGDMAWGERFLRLMMENLMMQRVKENTRYRSDDELARLDLVLTKGLHLKDDLRYGCPLGKSDHVIIEIETEEGSEEDESYKRNWLN